MASSSSTIAAIAATPIVVTLRIRAIPLTMRVGGRKKVTAARPVTNYALLTQMDVDRPAPGTQAAIPSMTDVELVERSSRRPRPVRDPDGRHNQQIYRAVRAVMGNDSEVEDVMQQAYLNAFAHLDAFEFRSQFSTWLTRIALNEAFGRRRARQLLSSMPRRTGGSTSGTLWTE